MMDDSVMNVESTNGSLPDDFMWGMKYICVRYV